MKPSTSATTSGTESQVQEVGPSSAPLRPHPRPRTKKAPAAEFRVVDQTQSERPRPKPKPRAKKAKETTEQHDIVENESTPERGASKDKGKGKQKTTIATSRKRKGRDETGDHAPTKRQKGNSKTQPKSNATDHPVHSTTLSAPEDLGALDEREGLDQGEENTSVGRAKEAYMNQKASIVEPTRRQPSRAASRKSIS